MLGQNFTNIVEDCLSRLDRGENLPDVLADYPAYQERLKPLLLVAMASRAINVPLPNDSIRHRGRNQMLAEMDQMAFKDYLHRYAGFSRFQSWICGLVNTLRAKALIYTVPNYRLAVVALTIAFGIGLFAVSASASNLPGGFLGSFSSDIRQALGLFEFDQTGPDRERPPALIFSGNDLHLEGSRAAKVAFLLDLLENHDQSGPGFGNQNKKQNQGSPGGSQTQNSNGIGSSETGGKDDTQGQQNNALGDSGSFPQNNPATAFAPGQQTGPAATYAPGQQDGPAKDSAPGQVKKLDADEDEKEKKDKKDKKDEKDKIDEEGGESGE